MLDRFAGLLALLCAACTTPDNPTARLLPRPGRLWGARVRGWTRRPECDDAAAAL